MDMPIRRTLNVETFSVADAEYFHKLGFTNRDLSAGLYAEKVCEGDAPDELVDIVRI